MIVRTTRFVLLRRLLSSCGATEAVGSAIPLSSIPDHRYHRGSTFARKVQTALAAESEFDLLFVHRDANSAGYEARSREISEAMGIVGRSIDWIPIIPGRQPGRSDEILITRNEVSQGSALNVVSFVVQVRPAVVSFLVHRLIVLDEEVTEIRRYVWKFREVCAGATKYLATRAARWPASAPQRSI